MLACRWRAQTSSLRLDVRSWPGGDGGDLMDQCSSSARHPTSHLPPRQAGGGTVLTEGLRLRPLVPSGAHPPAGRSKPRLSQAHCIAISSLLLGRPTPASWDGPEADRRLRALIALPSGGFPGERYGRLSCED